MKTKVLLYALVCILLTPLAGTAEFINIRCMRDGNVVDRSMYQQCLQARQQCEQQQQFTLNPQGLDVLQCKYMRYECWRRAWWLHMYNWCTEQIICVPPRRTTDCRRMYPCESMCERIQYKHTDQDYDNTNQNPPTNPPCIVCNPPAQPPCVGAQCTQPPTPPEPDPNPYEGKNNDGSGADDEPDNDDIVRDDAGSF